MDGHGLVLQTQAVMQVPDIGTLGVPEPLGAKGHSPAEWRPQEPRGAAGPVRRRPGSAGDLRPRAGSKPWGRSVEPKLALAWQRRSF